ncbi:MAG: MarR family transcriptional regulator [Caulobacterales bacterium]
MTRQAQRKNVVDPGLDQELLLAKSDTGAISKGVYLFGKKNMTIDLNARLRFGFLIHDVSRLRRIVIDRALKPVGITRSQWWVLAFLSRRDGMTQTALAQDLDLTKVAIGGLIDRMETAGFVERRADSSDGRARRVFLTKAGVKFVTTIRENVDRMEAEILARVSELDIQRAAKTLLSIKETLIDIIGADDDSDDGEKNDNLAE